MKFRNVKIGYKFLIAFFISVLLFVVATTVVYMQLTSVKDDVNDISEKSELAINLGKVSSYLEQKDALVANYVIVNSRTFVDDYYVVNEQLDELLDTVEPYYQTNELKDVFNQIKTNISEIDEMFFNNIVDQLNN